MAIEDDVERVWASLTERMQTAAPATAAAIRAPAGEEELRDAQQETGGAWPADVVAFYRPCNGVERSSAGYLFPGFCPLPLHGVHELESVVGTWQWHRNLVADQAREWAVQPVNPREQNRREMAGLGPAPNPYDTAELEAAPAGTQTMMWVRAWLPIAEDQSGSELVIDRRGGDQYGCALTVDKELVDEAPQRWDGLVSLLAAVDDALRTGDVVAGTRYRPQSVAGELHWERALRG